jgi:hypothetical protein
MNNPFTAHPHSVGETYWEHLGFAFRFGVKMGSGSVSALIHALCPFLFTATAGRINDELQIMRQRSPGRLKRQAQQQTQQQ